MTDNSFETIISQSEHELPVYENILAQLHALYAAAPAGNEKAKQWIQEIGGHIEYMKANIAAAKYYRDGGE